MSEVARTPAPLGEVRRYRNDAILRSFMDRYAVDHAEAERLFDDALQWLWLCARLRADRQHDPEGTACTSLAITPGMRLIDEMWHTMLLHTAEYRRLCESKLGGFIDHLPEQAAVGAAPPSPEDVRARLEAQLEYVHDHLGEATLRRWFIEYADRHTPEYLDQISIPRSAPRRQSA